MNAYEKYLELQNKADNYLRLAIEKMDNETLNSCFKNICDEYIPDPFSVYLELYNKKKEQEDTLKYYCDYHRFKKLEEFIVEEDK